MNAIYRDLHLTIDFDLRAVELDSKAVTMTDKEYDLLAFLVRHAGIVISREMLLSHVWKYSTEVRTRTIDAHLSRLRKALAPYGNLYLERLFRVGCRFQPCTRALQADAEAKFMAIA